MRSLLSSTPMDDRHAVAKYILGCLTCKAKRLKCDEVKPTCQQCQKRNVPCGGYKKDFKWRAFEETAFAPKLESPSKGKKSKREYMELLYEV